MEYNSPRTKLYHAIFTKKCDNISITINDFVKYGYYDVLIDVAETTNDIDFFIKVIKLMPDIISNQIIFSANSISYHDKDFNI